MDVARWRSRGAIALFALAGWSCGAGSAGLVSSGGGGGGGNAPPSISGFVIDDPKISPTEIRFVLSDAEANPADLDLRYQVGGAPAQRLTQISGVSTNPVTLATSAQGVEHTLQWDFAAEPDLPDDASYVPGVQVFGTLAGGLQEIQVGTNAAATGLGNDPPSVDSVLVPAPGQEASGIVLIELIVSDSSNDAVSVRIEYDIEGDVPDAGWQLARGAQDDVTPSFAIHDVIVSAVGTQLAFFWNTSADLEELERDVRLRFTAVDRVIQGGTVASSVFRIDNNEEPIASIQADVLVLSSDQRRGIPIPFTVIDKEEDDVQVVFQWRRENEIFPALPTSPAAIASILADPDQRRAHHVCSEFPRPIEGIAVPIDSTHLRLPELAGQAAHLLAAGIVARELQILRPPNRIESLAQDWTSNQLVNPVAAVPLGDGLTALVLDSSSTGSWRLREIELATGAVVRDLAAGAGNASAVAVENSEHFVLVASDVAGAWRVVRVDVLSGALTELVVWTATTEQGQIRGIASLGTGAALITVGNSLVRLDYASYPITSAVTLLDDLATPWGVVLDAMNPNRAYVAEHDAIGPLGLGRVIRVDMNGLCIEPVVALAASGSEPGFPRPGPLALERGNRLLAVCELSPFPGWQLFGVDLGGGEGNEVFSLASLPTASALATGMDGLRLVTCTESADVLAGGGIEQSRLITVHDHTTHLVTVDDAFNPAVTDGRRWRLFQEFEASSGVTPARGTFVWNSADVQGGDIFFRATPLDAEVGVSAETSAPKRILAPLQDSEPLVVGRPVPISAFPAVTSADLDGDGDQDLVSTNFSADSLNVLFQTSPGVFAQTPLVLGGGIATNGPRAVTCADMDGDGDQDIVCANFDSNDLRVFFQTSPGVFTQGLFAVGGTATTKKPQSVATSDLDGDGDQDIVCANWQGHNLTVFFQAGPGLFAATPLVLGDARTTENPSGVTCSDLDGDGDQDIVSANYSSSNVTVFFQTSPGVFAHTPLLLGDVGITPNAVSVTCSDLDGDGDQDIVSANGNGNNLTVFFQTSPGDFAQSPLALGDISTTPYPIWVTCSDLDGDGDQDIVSANAHGGNLTVFFQTNSGVFAEPPLVVGEGDATDSPSSVISSDLDGDGDQDIVCPNSNNNLTVFLQTSPGDFGETPLTLGGLGTTNAPMSVTSSDLDGDGDQDVVSANFNSNNLTVFVQTSPRVFAATPLVLGGAGTTDAPWPVTCSDLDGDGDQDVVCGNGISHNLTVFFQTSPGVFAATPLVLGGLSTTSEPISVTASDLDGDGDQDIVAANVSGNAIGDGLTVFFQTRPGIFATPPLVLGEIGTMTFPMSVTSADLDGDGDQDIVSANAGSNNLTVFFQTSAGVFADIPLVLGARGTTDAARSVTCSDLDGDGDLDIVSANAGSNNLTVFFQTSPGVFAKTPLVLGGFGITDEPFSVRSSDLDGDGDQDIVSANFSSHNLTVFFQTRPGVFAATPLVLGGFGTTNFASSVTSSDLDGDGDQDIISANTDSQNLTVFWGCH